MYVLTIGSGLSLDARRVSHPLMLGHPSRKVRAPDLRVCKTGCETGYDTQRIGPGWRGDELDAIWKWSVTWRALDRQASHAVC